MDHASSAIRQPHLFTHITHGFLRQLARLIGPIERQAVRFHLLFDDPDRLDIRRANAKEHIAFGYGAHICIGAPLARLELKVVLEEVSARLPGLRMVPGQKLRYLPNTSFRGPRSLLVEWET